jgi:DNA-binding LacI/PurR family transcriptional regulator
MKIRMKDIARDLGLSVVTTSKVLRSHPDISDTTRDRVLQRIKELNYSPNLNARSLVTGRSYMIGLVVPDLLHPFFAEIAKSLSRQIRDSGYYLLIASSDGDQGLEEFDTIIDAQQRRAETKQRFQGSERKLAREVLYPGVQSPGRGQSCACHPACA